MHFGAKNRPILKGGTFFQELLLDKVQYVIIYLLSNVEKRG